MLSIGFVSGLILNAINHRREVDALPWTDPVVWSSGLLLAWMLAAAVFSALYRPARQGRKIAYLTLASFMFLVPGTACTPSNPSAPHLTPSARPIATSWSSRSWPAIRDASGYIVPSASSCSE